jgi:oligosaccharyltransferase complex subunit alpha (ribophorin I)
MELHVPPTASDFSYRDEIGNISTSRVATSPNFTQLLIGPRFPLYGGWKINFYVEYSVPFTTLADVQEPVEGESLPHLRFFFSDTPAEQQQKKTLAPRAFKIALPFAPSMQRAATDDCVLRIALPEGATNVAVRSDIDGLRKDAHDEVTYSLLDYLGRRTLILRRSTVLNSPAFGSVIVEYDVPPLYRVHKPVLVLAIVLVVIAALELLIRGTKWFTRGTLDLPLPDGSAVGRPHRD